VKKVYEGAKTPYQRLMESEEISTETKERLQRTYESINLVELKERLDKLILRLMAKPIEMLKGRSYADNILIEPVAHFADSQF
jgi:hypothetical protein